MLYLLLKTNILIFTIYCVAKTKFRSHTSWVRKSGSLQTPAFVSTPAHCSMPTSYFMHSEFRMLRFKWCVLNLFLCMFLLLVASNPWSEFQAPPRLGVKRLSVCAQVPWLGFLSLFYEQPFGCLFNVLSLTWQDSLMPSFLFTLCTLRASSSLSLASS